MDISHTNFKTVAFETMLKAPQIGNIMTICMYTYFSVRRVQGGWLAHCDCGGGGKSKENTSMLHAKNDPWIELHRALKTAE